MIRAFNVLRQYEEEDFAPAYERLAEYVLPGGLMIEGTSTTYGQIWTANLVRKLEAGQPALGKVEGWDREALVLSTNFRLGFDVEEFQTVLPKNLIHQVIKGELIHDFFEAWKASAAETSAMKTYGARQWFSAAAERMAERGYAVASQRKWLTKGYLIWKPD